MYEHVDRVGVWATSLGALPLEDEVEVQVEDDALLLPPPPPFT